MNAVILLGHGSRAQEVAVGMDRLAAALAAGLPGTPVRAAHMELCQPDLSTVAAGLIAEGASRITVLPYFLHLGNHLRRDIPELLDGLRRAYPKVEFLLGAPLGFDERIVSVLQQRLAEVWGGQSSS